MLRDEEFESLGCAIRHAAHLIELAPRPLRHVLRVGLDDRHLEALLDAGMLEDAARALVGDSAQLTTVTAASGGIKASLRCPFLGRQIEAVGECKARAILIVWSTCLLSLKDAMLARDIPCNPHGSTGRAAAAQKLWLN